MKTAFGFVLVSLLSAPASAGASTEDVVMRAMRDELARSIEKLQLQSLDRPYFIAYSVSETASQGATASFGAAVGSNENRNRSIAVELRVGDRKVDNTGYVAPPGGSSTMRSFGSTVTLPLDDDYQEIRRQIWLATDAAYKKALEDLSRKRAYLQSKTRSDDSPDFAEAEPATVADAAPPAPVRLAELEALARELSTTFRSVPAIFTSRVSVQARSLLTRYVNSEGSSFTRSSPRLGLSVSAATQAEDGTPIEDTYTAYGRTLAELPPAAALRAEVAEMGQRLAVLRGAPHLDTYNGPVLFEGQAAAELVAQALAPKLLAVRRPILDDSRMGGAMETPENPFLDKIGGRVLPEGLAVVDDPTRTELGGQRLLGGYKVDDDGVPARTTQVVEDGILKSLLSTRTPVRGIVKSSGNRRGNGPMPTNLLLTADKGQTDAELKEALLKAVKERNGEYGIIVRRMLNPVSAQRPFSGAGAMMMSPRDRENRLETAVLAVKVFPDGKEEPVRIAEIVGLGAEAFKDVVAAGKEPAVYTAMFRPVIATPFSFSPPDLVSYGVPSLLFKEASLRKPRTEFPKPPVGGHPGFAR